MHQRRNIILTSMLLLVFAASGIAHAQSQPPPLQYTVAPETPGPNQVVNIQVAGVGTFLGDSTITWQQNGKTVDSGIGHESYTFTTGAIGTATTIHVVIVSPTQGTFTNDFFFAPSVVDLVWEADTSVPLFYAGKSLYSAGARLKVVAFPTIAQGKSIASVNSLSFQWSQGGTPVPDQSGIGKNTFTFNGDQIHNSETVSVDIYLSGAKVGHGEIVIPAQSPQVILYDSDPLRGELLDRALPSSFDLNTNEVTLQAEPYFFSNQSIKNGALTFSWTLNGSETSGPDSAKGLLTLRQAGQGTGSATVGVSVQDTNPTTLIQAASEALQITFGGQASGSSLSSFFGL